MKNKLSLLLAFCIAATLLSGCSDDNKKSEANTEKTTTKSTTAVSVSDVSIPDSEYVKVTADKLTYSDNPDGGVTIKSYLGTDKALIIPSEINAKKVTSIGSSAFKDSILKAIKLPATVTQIESLAFHNCPNLVHIEMPEGLKAIGNAAFFNCICLYKIDFPKSIQSIGENAFSGTTWLQLQSEEFITVGDGYLLLHQGNQADVEIPNTVKIIGSYSFKESNDLKSVVIPNTVTSIEAYAFSECINLEKIEIPNSVTSIKDSALFNCQALKELTIPSSVTEFGKRAFGYYTDPSSNTSVMKELTLTCDSGSKAEEYAKENKINYKN